MLRFYKWDVQIVAECGMLDWDAGCWMRDWDAGLSREDGGGG